MPHIARMHSDSPYHRHRFPAEIISHSVWWYFRFVLSFRDVEEMLSMRGVSRTHETVREWCPQVWPELRQLLATPSSSPGRPVAHLIEVFLKINGRIHYLLFSVSSVPPW